ncbi:MAG: DinB family protein [Ginsengibacter sp.]
MKLINKPNKDEYPPYAEMYMRLVPEDGLVLRHLETNGILLKKLFLSIPTEKLLYRYSPDKWTLKEILVHLVDDERIYTYRALRFARNDNTELPGFNQDDFARFSGANERDLHNILEEYDAVRKASITLFNGLPDEALTRVGRTNESMVSVRALAYHITGHELHHLNIIKEKYLKE